ncbi:hypothetical protein [Xanthobacter versatilis]|uniref:hypothetical protein n=1 Tax=Xanthobacter autotrophicus (strain ATCC BAA-1158 / Py2) TaxID=78245 RepID=UPI0037277C86
MAKVTITKEAAPVDAAPTRATFTDKLGRSITIKKMGALDRMKLFEAVGSERSQNEMYFGYASLAASVVDIDGEAIMRPANHLQIEALVQRLGDEGLEAIATQYAAKWGAAAGLNAEAAKN